jgi:hypothetical protein
MSTHEQRTSSDATRRAYMKSYYWEMKADPVAYAAILKMKREAYHRRKERDPEWHAEHLRKGRLWAKQRRRFRIVRRLRRQAHLFVRTEYVPQAVLPIAAAKAIRARLLDLYGFTIDDIKATDCKHTNLTTCRWHILEEVRQIAPHWPLVKLRDLVGFQDHTSVIYALNNLKRAKYLKAKRTLA